MNINQIEGIDERNNMTTSISFNDYKLKYDFKMPDSTSDNLKPVTKSTDKEKSEKTDKSASDSDKNADNNSKVTNVLDRSLRFEIKDVKNDDGKVEKKLVISVLDQETGKVIRTVPPEELQEAAKNLTDFAGKVFDKIG